MAVSEARIPEWCKGRNKDVIECAEWYVSKQNRRACHTCLNYKGRRNWLQKSS